jgi:para-aminobenzoate synthetase component I
MIKDPSTYNFFALFTNNGNFTGFKNAVAYSQDKVREINLDETDKRKNTIIPIIGYDLKNKFEDLVSKNTASYFFKDLILAEPDNFEFIDEKTMNSYLKISPEQNFGPIKIKARVSKEQYLLQVRKLKKHIQEGDIYEVNYCIEFYAENVDVNAFELYKHYNSIARSPMSCFVKYSDINIICGSPERFLKRENTKITSEPIKGTRKRSENSAGDDLMIKELENDQKERAENIMIVDLVRNDLSKIATKGSVNVEELCKVYTFPTVHQSISRISCETEKALLFETVLKACFPMGSMTGAPKISAMQLIDKAENSKRQIYSGSIGYLLPGGDFDLNVVIRTMIYDEKNKYLSFMVGSAITAASDPEKEYEECLIKASAMLKAINGTLE